MFRKIALRLGMDGGLYIGICLGAMAAAAMILCLILFWSPGMNTVIFVTVVLLLCSVVLAGLVALLQAARKKSPDLLCTCRYRSSLYTYCRECALKEKDAGPADRPDRLEK